MVYFRGSDYPSVSEVCETYNISRSCMYYYNEGEPILETIEWYLSNHGDFRKLKYKPNYEYYRDGKGYRSFSAFCKEKDISVGHITKLTKKHNISRDEAVDRVLEGRKSHEFNYHGEIYPSFYKFCMIKNINRNYMHLKSKTDGTDLVETVDNYLRAKKDRKESFPFRGVEYKSLNKCLQHFKIEPITFRKYRKKLNLTDTEAIEYCLRNKERLDHRKSKKPYNFEGQNYHSFTDCRKHFGVSAYKINKRIEKYNISREDALRMCIKEMKEAENASNNRD